MRPVILFLIIFLSGAALAETPPPTLWPPDGCPSKEPGIATWQEGTQTGTRCLTAQQILKLALPGCKAGQLVQFDGTNFVCKDSPRKSAKAEQ